MDLAVANKKEEAAAVLRAHGARHSLHFAAQEGMTDEVAAGIAAGQDVNARDPVILLCVCVWTGGYLITHRGRCVSNIVLYMCIHMRLCEGFIQALLRRY